MTCIIKPLVLNPGGGTHANSQYAASESTAGRQTILLPLEKAGIRVSQTSFLILPFRLF